MGCLKCAERRKAIMDASQAVFVHGDVKTARVKLGFIASSSVRDLHATILSLTQRPSQQEDKDEQQ